MNSVFLIAEAEDSAIANAHKFRTVRADKILSNLKYKRIKTFPDLQASYYILAANWGVSARRQARKRFFL